VTPFPIRLLRLLYIGEASDPLVGDVIEKYREESSFARLWKEVAVLLVVTAWRGFRDHPGINIRAAIAAPAIGSIAFILNRHFLVPVVARLPGGEPVAFLVVLPTIFLVPALSCGLIGAALYRREWMVCALSTLLVWTVWVSVRIWNIAHNGNSDFIYWSLRWELIRFVVSALGFVGGILLALRLPAPRRRIA
jgi:hypothetical protein